MTARPGWQGPVGHRKGRDFYSHQNWSRHRVWERCGHTWVSDGSLQLLGGEQTEGTQGRMEIARGLFLEELAVAWTWWHPGKRAQGGASGLC